MQLPKSIVSAFEKEGGFLSMRQLAALGVSRTSAGRYVRTGLLERVAHGLYKLPSGLDDSLFLLLSRNPALVASHETALFLNGLAEGAPEQWSVTAPRGHEPSRTVRRECMCFYVDAARVGLGAVRRVTPWGHEVRCYDPERTICDLVRSRGRLDDQIVLSGLRNWAASPSRDPARLVSHARAMGTFSKVKAAVEALL